LCDDSELLQVSSHKMPQFKSIIAKKNGWRMDFEGVYRRRGVKTGRKSREKEVLFGTKA